MQSLALQAGGEPHWLDIARGYIGWTEERENLRIAQLGQEAGFPNFNPITTPWCSIFVDIVMHQAGDPGTDNAMARSWKSWAGGDPVELDDLQPGDIVVLTRGPAPFGHVGFFIRREGDVIYLLGGNQSNAVTVAPFKASRFLGARRPRINAKPIEAVPGEASAPTGLAFGTALEAIFAVEGGWANHPKDPDGATMWGITLATYSSWRAMQGYPTTTQRDLAALTQEEAAQIYEQMFWRGAKCHLLPRGLALIVFDCAVNQGVARAIKLLQIAVGTVADGQFGPKTMAAVEAADLTATLIEFGAQRMNHYGSLSTFPIFGLGWSRRLSRCLVVQTRLAGSVDITPPADAPQPPPDEFADEPIPDGSPNYGSWAKLIFNLIFEVVQIAYPQSRTAQILFELREALRKNGAGLETSGATSEPLPETTEEGKSMIAGVLQRLLGPLALVIVKKVLGPLDGGRTIIGLLIAGANYWAATKGIEVSLDGQMGEWMKQAIDYLAADATGFFGWALTGVGLAEKATKQERR